MEQPLKPADQLRLGDPQFRLARHLVVREGQRQALELVEELDRLSLPFTEDQTPSEAELRIAQAQLVGWLEGLFHGIQTTLFAQQMAARAQLEQMRRALPPGVMPGPGGPEEAAQPGRSSGPYL